MTTTVSLLTGAALSLPAAAAGNRLLLLLVVTVTEEEEVQDASCNLPKPVRELRTGCLGVT